MVQGAIFASGALDFDSLSAVSPLEQGARQKRYFTSVGRGYTRSVLTKLAMLLG